MSTRVKVRRGKAGVRDEKGTGYGTWLRWREAQGIDMDYHIVGQPELFFDQVRHVGAGSL